MHHNMPMMGGKKLPEQLRGQGNPVAAEEPSRKRGRKLFQTYCAICH